MITGKHAMIVGVVALMVAVLGVIGIITAAGDALEDDHIFLGSPSDIAVHEIIPDCSTTANDKLQYDQATNELSCDSTAPGSSITTEEDNADPQTVSQIDWQNGLDRTFAAGEDVMNVDITKATNPVALTDDNTWIGDSSGDAAEEAFPDCDDSGGNHLNYDTATNALSCGTSSSGGGGGDEVTVNSVAVDTTANFLDGDIDWTLVDGGAGGPDDITATVECTGCVSDTDLATDFIAESELDTEAKLETQLTDVTNVYTNNDGSLVRSATFVVCSSTTLDQLSCDYLADGIADEVQIEAALTACPAVGCLVLLREGIFNVAGSGFYNLDIDHSNFTLQGMGPGLTTIRASILDRHLIGNSSTGFDYMTIRDMTLDHDAVALGTGSFHLLRFEEVTHVWLENLEILNSGHHGITFGPDTASEVNTEYFINNIYAKNIGVSGQVGGDAIRTHFGSGNVIISNVIIDGVELHGVHLGNHRSILNNIVVKNSGAAAFSFQSEGQIASNLYAEWDAITSDLAANRPAAGTAGRWFYATDTVAWSRDNGSAWQTEAGITMNGIRIATRAAWGTAERIVINNVKLVFAVTENETYDFTSGNGIDIADNVGQVQLSNIQIDGKFRHGVFASSNKFYMSNFVIENTRHTGVQLGDSSGTTTGFGLINGSIINSNQETADAAIRLHVSVRSARVEGVSTEGSNHTWGIIESAGADDNIIVGNDLNGITGALLVTGVNTIYSNNRGTTEAKGFESFLFDNQTEVRFGEPDGAGSEYIAVKAPATLAANRTCTLEDDATPFDPCVTASAVTLVSDPGGTTATTSSESGLELVTGELSMLRGCSNGQIEKWVSATESWDCSADSTGGTPTFDSIATGTNTTATMTVGDGAIIDLAPGGLNLATGVLNTVNNDSGGTLFECTAVFISGFDIPSDLPEVSIADADATDAAMGLMFADLANGSDGFVTISGQIDDLDTDTGEGWSVGDRLFLSDSGVSADTDCGNTLTNTRPANTDDMVQALAIVERVHATQGRLKVIGAGRANDLSNLPDDNMWIGSSGNIATETAIPDCDDTGGNHLNYDDTTNAVSCGTSVRAIDISADTNLAVSGTLLDLTGDTLSVNEGTLTDEALCMFEGTGTQIECTVSTKATLEAQISDVADFAEADGDVFTGVHDFGGATSVEIPNGAGGTAVDAAGEVTIDTTSDTLNFFDGTIEGVLNPVKCGGITVENPSSSEDLTIHFTPFAVTVTEMRAVLIGSDTPSVTWTVRHGVDRADTGAEVVTSGTTTTSVTTGDDVTSFNDATIIANSFFWLETTAQSGTVTELHLTICFRQDA